jgi:hypothetical protein
MSLPYPVDQLETCTVDCRASAGRGDVFEHEHAGTDAVDGKLLVWVAGSP